MGTYVSNGVLVGTTFTSEWQGKRADDFNQSKQAFEKVGRDTYKMSQEYFTAANKILKDSKTPQAQRVAKDLAEINKRKGFAMEKMGTDLFKKSR